MNVPQTPTLIPIRLVCPDCDQALQVDMEVTTVMTSTTDMEGDDLTVLKPKVKVQSISHQHNQLSIDDAITGSSS